MVSRNKPHCRTDMLDTIAVQSHSTHSNFLFNKTIDSISFFVILVWSMQGLSQIKLHSFFYTGLDLSLQRKIFPYLKKVCLYTITLQVSRVIVLVTVFCSGNAYLCAPYYL